MLADNFAALIYLKNQVKKWKTIALISLFLVLFTAFGIDKNKGKTDNALSGDYVASIKVENVIVENDYSIEILEKIANQKNIKALIVNIDSPGGTIVGSENLFQAIREVAAKKPVVALINGVGASGGYMVASAADYIIARNGTLTGSIGVIMQSAEFTEMAQKLGVKLVNYKSSPLKGAPSAFEKSTPEVDRVMNQSIQDGYKFFADLVLERRKGKLKGDISTIIDGRVFTGRQALKNGLIDEIGSKKEVLKYLTSRKVATNKIEEISIVEDNGSWLEKIIGNDDMTGLFGAFFSQGKLMGILNY